MFQVFRDQTLSWPTVGQQTRFSGETDSFFICKSGVLIPEYQGSDMKYEPPHSPQRPTGTWQTLLEASFRNGEYVLGKVMKKNAPTEETLLSFRKEVGSLGIRMAGSLRSSDSLRSHRELSNNQDGNQVFQPQPTSPTCLPQYPDLAGIFLDSPCLVKKPWKEHCVLLLRIWQR